MVAGFQVSINGRFWVSTEGASGDTQRGLVILDNSAHETTLQKMSVEFRTLGTRWGSIKSLADTPLFVDSRASRVIQLADHVAYAVFRRYQSGDTQYLDRIAHKFDAEDGIVHGLAHKEIGNPNCMCIACISRASRAVDVERALFTLADSQATDKARVLLDGPVGWTFDRR